MGTGKKKKEPVSGTKKELVIIARPVVTLDQVKGDERKKNLLALFNLLTDKGGIYEKTLNYLLYWFKSEKGIDMGYNFVMLGDVPYSRELHEDLVALLYLGLLETTPTKKIRITNEGREFLQKVGYDTALLEKVKEALEEYWPKATTIDAQIELETTRRATMAARRRRRRSLFGL
ncbi:hypothetical protein Pyrfu_0072 [Pyrolobus fumarii 1A]|uniref:Uncharacterized protein n=1 Tax=Pyrolobus fumarii (strain DSM 11204 / 1A) TaxID=694429 RepID=G0EE28_PYRF1|nr:hypothetical protein [Pyrolobus fumarii]AEM37944.1 hypothetical protein Pyrfu_0072 [Pyrolobus fumarii 1A]